MKKTKEVHHSFSSSDISRGSRSRKRVTGMSVSAPAVGSAEEISPRKKKV